MDAQIIGVSTDTLAQNRKFAVENGIRFPLVSDADRSIKRAYGWGRVTYLIDKAGVIRHAQKGVPDNAVFLEQLQRLE